MAEKLCQHGSCQVWIPRGEGVTVSGGGYRVKFCCWDHAAKWVLAMADRLESRTTGVHARTLGYLEIAQKALKEVGL